MKSINNPTVFRKNISKKFINTIINEKNASNLEKGIFNYTLKECERRNIAKIGPMDILYRCMWIVFEVFI